MKNAASSQWTCAWSGGRRAEGGVATANVLSVMATKSQGNDANMETKTTAKYLPILFSFILFWLLCRMKTSSVAASPAPQLSHTHIGVRCCCTSVSCCFRLVLQLPWLHLLRLFPACQASKTFPSLTASPPTPP